MKLRGPFKIGARLMPAIQIGDGWLSLAAGPRNADGRTEYLCFIDLPGGAEYEVTDLRSGCQGGGVQEGFESLLSFLSAAAESYAYRMRTGRQGENEDLFLPAVVEWAHANADELSLLACELSEQSFIED